MKLFISAFFLALTMAVNAKAPHITGTVTIDMQRGLIDCDFSLSNLPQENMTVLLNKGMNIQYFTDASGNVVPYKGFYDFKAKGEGIEYTIGEGKLPNAFGMKYRGAFPVYTDKLSFIDFKGIIAFNGKTLRAAEQSKWYPVLYDAANDRLIEAYTYSITVNINDGQTVYLNGAPPQKATSVTFTSESARPLLLFAGDYSYISSGKNYLLNANVSEQTATSIFRGVDVIKTFLSEKLKLPYGDNLYFMSHSPLEKYKEGRSWAFVTFPTFAFAGTDFNTILDNKGNLIPEYNHFIAHETSHFYFSTATKSGKLGWFWLESGAEYLAIKTSQKLNGQQFYADKIKEYCDFVKGKDFKPLAKIENPEDVNGNYRYKYGPLILSAFEKTFGEEKTYAILASIITKASTQTITLDVLKSTAIDNGISAKEYNAFYDTYLNSKKAVDSVIKKNKG